MRAPLKLAAFAAVLLVALTAALLAGRVSGVDGAAATEPPAHDDHTGEGEGEGEGDGDAHEPEAGIFPGGLQVAADGYAIEVLEYPAEPGDEQSLRFRITGPDGAPVTEFTENHEADLHLVVVRRDLADYQHLHPDLATDGTWSVPVTFAGAGSYRAYADFVPAGRADGLTLGVDLAVAGEFVPDRADAAAHTAEVDGYTITLDGHLVAGTASQLTLSVSRAGAPVTDLEPYLGAGGHLVALRDGDLAYLHVHPEDEATAGPDVGFAVEAPSAGTYQLYFEFQHEGTVRTVEFTLEAAHDD